VIVRNSRLSLSPEATWGELSPLVDRPFLQHLAETIVGQGVREVDFVLPEEDRVTTKMLGNGTRWGARFRYHAVAGTADIHRAFQQMTLHSADEAILLAHSDRLPELRLDGVKSGTTLFCWKDKDTELHWTGWGLIRAADARLIPKGMQEQGLIEFLLKSGTDVVCLEGQRPLMACSYDDLLESNRRVLSKEFTGLLLGGTEVQPGVWMARNVRVHPTAWLAPPAYLGENCRVGALAQVGPAAAIGRDCLIERETHVANSVICGGSYVGQQLALSGVVVDRSRLINTTCDVEIEGVDELLLGSVFGVPLRTRVCRICSRMAAIVALIVWSPVLIAMYIGSIIGVVPAFQRRLVVRTPAVSHSYRWKTFPLWSFGEEQIPAEANGWLAHFFFCFLPALLTIAAGYMDLVGPRPRTSDELENLPATKRFVYLRSRCGILQTEFSAGSVPDEDIPGSGIVRAPWRETMAVVTGYFGCILCCCLPGMPPVTPRRKAE
jgi:hypothetical protein